MTKQIQSIPELEAIKIQHNFSFVYFKNDKCSVCDSLFPQLERRVDEWNEKLYVVDCNESPDIAAQSIVLTVPALKVYYDGQEIISMLRFVDLLKLEHDYKRLKNIIE